MDSGIGESQQFFQGEMTNSYSVLLLPTATFPSPTKLFRKTVTVHSFLDSLFRFFCLIPAARHSLLDGSQVGVFHVVYSIYDRRYLLNDEAK